MDIIKRRIVKHLGYNCLGPTTSFRKIEQLRKKINTANELKAANKYFIILAGKTRLKILYLLQHEKELCVCDISDILKINISAVSHQLKILRASKLVKFRRNAQTIFYFLSKSIKKELKTHFKNKL